MAEFSDSIMIHRDVDSVWSLVGTPDRINQWLPFIETSRVDGSARHCTAINGAQLEEKIVNRNDAQRSYQYTIESAPMPIDELLATITVSAAGADCSLVTWHTFVEPAELIETFAPIYREGLENLRTQLEG